MYIKTLLTAAAAATAFAAAIPATAQPVSQSEAQLARSLGVDAGQFSLNQLVKLKNLSTEDRSEAMNRIDFVRDNARQVSRDSVNVDTTQFSRSLGVEPGTLSTTQLQRLQTALVENDTVRADYIRNGTASNAPSTAGKAQLAASLGVSADAYTLPELVALQSRLVNDER
ncbi:hypothetical protein LCGC14_1807740 [marine sediment metagenome]|uniref:Uncharacterized protein n=1 Tax=marine sediment metagenome TaxID=412755 RepID=A0A0F9HAP8_9ZZZZ